MAGPSEVAEEKPDANGHSAQEAPAESAPRKRRSRWDETPAEPDSAIAPITYDTDAPKPATKRSRWDQAPTSEGVTVTSDKLQASSSENGVPSASHVAVDPRNRYMTDEELDNILPSDGYAIVEPPPDYAPVRTPAQKLVSAPITENGGFMMQEEGASRAILEEMIPDLPTDIPGVGQLAFFKTEDQTFFKKILTQEDEGTLSAEEQKERKIMRLLLKIKNGTPATRKTALRQISDRRVTLDQDRSLTKFFRC